MIHLALQHGSIPPSREARYCWLRERASPIVDLPAESLAVQFDELGAPRLENTHWRVSFSHHGEWLAAALSDETPVGLDVLTVPADADFVADTASVLSEAEIEHVRRAARTEQGAAFASCWTRKEAYAKLLRTGLTADLPGLTLTPEPLDGTPASFWSRRVADCMITVAAPPGSAAWSGASSRP